MPPWCHGSLDSSVCPPGCWVILVLDAESSWCRILLLLHLSHCEWRAFCGVVTFASYNITVAAYHKVLLGISSDKDARQISDRKLGMRLQLHIFYSLDCLAHITQGIHVYNKSKFTAYRQQSTVKYCSYVLVWSADLGNIIMRNLTKFTDNKCFTKSTWST